MHDLSKTPEPEYRYSAIRPMYAEHIRVPLPLFIDRMYLWMHPLFPPKATKKEPRAAKARDEEWSLIGKQEKSAISKLFLRLDRTAIPN